MALYHCAWHWFPHQAARPAAERDQHFGRIFVASDAAQPNTGEHVKGWYAYPGQAAGFLLIEANSHEELAQILRPYLELMEFDAKPVVSIDYQQRRQEIKR